MKPKISCTISRTLTPMMRMVHITATICFFLTLSSSSAFSQGLSQTIGFSYPNTPLNVKHYSTEMVLNPNTSDEQVMAGTIYHEETGVYSSIHFLRLDDAGVPLTSVEFESDPDVEAVVDDYIFRSVDIAPAIFGSDNIYFITCLGQGNRSPYGYATAMPYTYAGQVSTDIIRIIVTNDAGSLLNVLDITDNTNTGLVYPGHNLEPLNSMYMEYGGAKLLYICGYAYLEQSLASTGGAPVTNYKGAKKAFVLCVDVTDIYHMNVLKGMTYDTPPIAIPNPSANEVDFDMAIRIKEIANGPYASSSTTTPCIFVTGSTNAQTSSPTGYNRSTSMIYTLNSDPSNSTPFLTFATQDIGILPNGGVDGSGEMEYGVDMVEDATGGFNYLISNKMPNIMNLESNNYPPDYNYKAMDPEPSGLIISKLNQSFALEPVPRYYYEGIWGIHGLSSITSPANGYFNFMVAGFMNKNYIDKNSNTHTASISDIKPYLFDLGINTASSTPTTENSFTYYNTSAGTGVPGTDPYNYFTLGSFGNGSCNIYWNPVFAARSGNMVYMGTPKWDTELKLKWIQADGSSINPAYNDDGCSASFLLVKQPATESNTAVGNPIVDELNLNTSSPTPNTLAPTPDIIACSGSYYKTNKIKIKGPTSSTTQLYPNPAASTINLSLGVGIARDADVKVQLLNLQGQLVSTLYSGKAGKAAKSYSLPAIPAGMYIAQVYADGTMVHQQKLVVQQ